MALSVGVGPEIRAASDGEPPPGQPPLSIGPLPFGPLSIGPLPGDRDEDIVTEGGMKGQNGFFTRDSNGSVVG
jgi:hypothetical protein